MKVIILPGFLKSAYFFKSLVEALKKAGHNAQIIDFKRNVSIFKSIDEHAEYLIQNLEQGSNKFVIIADSFGGIILKRLIQIRPDLKQNLSGIVFVTVPHHGSWMALLLSIFPAMHELLPNSKIITETEKLPLPKNVINFLADSEIKIRPKKSGELKDFPNIVISGTNHDNVVKNQNFIHQAIKFINNL